jgi:hypothetical protein
VGVIFIGDRNTGKTHLALTLASPGDRFVKVLSPEYSTLKDELYDEDTGSTLMTAAEKEVDVRSLEVQVRLPSSSSPRRFFVDWVDTPGEIWRPSWQKDNPKKWKNFLNTVRTSQGIVLILPPYREIVAPEYADEFMLRQQWCNRFERWAQFFSQDCPNAKHILICLNKADLLRDIDIEDENDTLAFDPDGSPMSWQERQNYVFNRYFRSVQPQISAINQSISGLAVRCFMTSIKDRNLLELPWIYLGAFLSR